jgi:hypothetical protein
LKLKCGCRLAPAPALFRRWIIAVATQHYNKRRAKVLKMRKLQLWLLHQMEVSENIIARLHYNTFENHSGLYR